MLLNHLCVLGSISFLRGNKNSRHTSVISTKKKADNLRVASESAIRLFNLLNQPLKHQNSVSILSELGELFHCTPARAFQYFII